MNCCIVTLCSLINIPSLRDLALQLVYNWKIWINLFSSSSISFVISLFYFYYTNWNSLSTWCITRHTEGISGPNAFYLCSQRDSEDKSSSSPVGDCRKTDSMYMHTRMQLLYETKLIKLPETEQIIHIAISYLFLVP